MPDLQSTAVSSHNTDVHKPPTSDWGLARQQPCPNPTMWSENSALHCTSLCPSVHVRDAAKSDEATKLMLLWETGKLFDCSRENP